MIINLLEETVKELNDVGLSFDSVSYVSMDGYRMEVETFKDLAARTNYECGYGEQEINSSLCIWGLYWIMFRCEYDGSEWWEMRIMPRDTKTRIPKHLYEKYSERAMKEGEQT